MRPYVPGYDDYQEASAIRRAEQEHVLRQRVGDVRLRGMLQDIQQNETRRRDLAQFEQSLPPAEQLKFRLDPVGYLKSMRPDPQRQAATQLAGLLATGGYQAPEGTPPTDGAAVPATSVASNDAEALARFGVRINPDGTLTQASPAPTAPMAVNVPNPNLVRGLAVAAEPEKSIPKVLDSLRPPQPQRPGQNITAVTGGYLQHNPDGTSTFVRTQEQQPRAEPAPSFHLVEDKSSPTGWSHQNTRTGVRVPGAPAPSSSTRPPRVMPAPFQKQLTEATELVDATERFVSTFKPEFGGKTITGDLGNRVGKVFGDDTGQTQWWQDYELHQSQIRNKLFGSALTTAEIDAWNKSAINPRMDADEIKKNLVRRETLERKAFDRLVNFGVRSGFGQDQIEALTGRPVGGRPGSVKTIANDAEYDALPSGSEFIGPDGSRRRKP